METYPHWKTKKAKGLQIKKHIQVLLIDSEIIFMFGMNQTRKKVHSFFSISKVGKQSLEASFTKVSIKHSEVAHL